MPTVPLSQMNHGSWNLRQGNSGVGSDVAIKASYFSGWLTFTQLILPQYDEVMDNSNMYLIHLFRQSGVDNAIGWVTQYWLAQPMRLSGGGKAVYWQLVRWSQAPFSTTRQICYTPNGAGSQTSVTNLNGQTIADTSGPNYIVLDCNGDTDGTYNWKGTLSRV